MEASIGDVSVFTADYRGHTPEELADMAVTKIIYVGRNSHPAIIDQAKAYREEIRTVLTHYFRMAQEAERANIFGALTKHGSADIAELIRRM
jgi:hypothetical protein